MSRTNRKQERDFTTEVKALQPEAEQLATGSSTSFFLAMLTTQQSGQLQEAVDKITLLEKQTRNVRCICS